MNRVPADEESWATAPYEAQYLKLIDTTSNAECARAAEATHQSKPAVLTRSYDNNRTGANTNEQSFTPAALESRGLRKVFSLKVEGDDPNIEAQPLYVPDVQMNDGTKHDVIYLFSMSNNVRAFDANTGAQLWPHPVSVGKPFVPDPSDPVDIYHINKSFGILSTPVIDRETGRIYAVNWIVDGNGNRQPATQGQCVELEGRQAAGGERAASSDRGLGDQFERAEDRFEPSAETARGIAARASWSQEFAADAQDAVCDEHRVRYPAAEARRDAAKSRLGRGFRRRRLEAGRPLAGDAKQLWRWNLAVVAGPAPDDQGNVYVVTSNGGYLPNPDGSKMDFNGQSDFAESFVKLSLEQGPQGPSLKLADWFSPFSRLDT